jgi:major type 1 subunit fimbrin (pilin)
MKPRDTSNSHFWSMLGLFALLLSFSAPSWALHCKSITGDAYLTEDIGPVSVPATVPDGTIIWRSRTHTVPAECWKHPDSYPNEDDPIYFYGNPSGIYSPAWGIEFGLVYKGRTNWDGDWSSYPSDGVYTGHTSHACPWTVTYPAMKQCTLVRANITFQVVIRKRGLEPLKTPTQDTYDVFQLDGKYGLYDGPSNPHGNFRYQLRGLQNIVGTDCAIDVTAKPEPGTVNFGTVQATTTGFSPPAPTRSFTLELNKACETAINIGATFMTAHKDGDYMMLPAADSKFGIQIRDHKNSLVPFNEPFPLAKFLPEQAQIIVPFTATMVPMAADIEEGPFEAMMVVQVVYY